MSTELSTPDESGRETGLTTSPHDEMGALMREVIGSRALAVHNLPADKMERFYLQSDALSDDCTPADEWDGPFAIRYFYAHPVQVTKPDGEVVDAVRCVLMDGDGNKVKCVSDGVANDLGRMAAVFGFVPWEPPILVDIKVVKTNRGFRLLRLQPIRTKPAGK